MVCQHCGASLAGRRADARYCSSRHRVAAFHARRNALREQAWTLLERQTAAIISGDAAALAAIAEEARALFAEAAA